MPNPSRKSFADRLHELPRFDQHNELASLLQRHGDSLRLLEGVIEQKIITKDEACRHWADAHGFAYVDPFASVITEEASKSCRWKLPKR